MHFKFKVKNNLLQPQPQAFCTKKLLNFQGMCMRMKMCNMQTRNRSINTEDGVEQLFFNMYDINK